MGYQHPELIRRLTEKLEMSHERATAAFEGMKLYLYTVGSTNADLSPPNDDIDEAWHNFMLFSRDYMTFCVTNFGHYLHHQPFTAEEAAEANANCKGCKTICHYTVDHTADEIALHM